MESATGCNSFSVKNRPESPLGMTDGMCRSRQSQLALRRRSLVDHIMGDEDSDSESDSGESVSTGTGISNDGGSTFTRGTRSTGDSSTFDADEEDELRPTASEIDVIGQLSLDKPDEETAIEILLEDSMFQLGPFPNGKNSEDMGLEVADDTSVESGVETATFDAASIGPADSIMLGKVRSLLKVPPEEHSHSPSSKVANSSSSKHSQSLSHTKSTSSHKPEPAQPEEELHTEPDPPAPELQAKAQAPNQAVLKEGKKPKKNLFKRIFKGIKRRGGHKKLPVEVEDVNETVSIHNSVERAEDAVLIEAEDAAAHGDEGSKAAMKEEASVHSKPLFLSADDPSMDPDLHVTPSFVPVRISRLNGGNIDDPRNDEASLSPSQISSLSGTQDSTAASSRPRRSRSKSKSLATPISLNRNMSMGSASVQDVRKVLKQMEMQLGKASGKGCKVSREKVMRALLTVAGSLDDVDEREELQNELSDLIDKELLNGNGEKKSGGGEAESECSDDDDESDDSSASSSSVGEFGKENQNEEKEGLFNIFSSVGKLFNPAVKDRHGVDRVLEDLEDLEKSELARRHSIANASAQTTTDDVPKSIPAKWKTEPRRRPMKPVAESPTPLQGTDSAGKGTDRTGSVVKSDTKSKPQATPKTKKLALMEASNTKLTNDNINAQPQAKPRVSPTKIKPLPPPRETPARARYSMTSPKSEVAKPKPKPTLVRTTSASSGVSSKSNRSGLFTPSRSWWRRRPSSTKDSADESTEPSLSNSSDDNLPPAGDGELSAFLDNGEPSNEEAIEQTVEERPLNDSSNEQSEPSGEVVGLKRTVTATDRLEYQLKLLNLTVEDTEMSRSMSLTSPMRSFTIPDRSASPQSTVMMLFPDEESCEI